MSTTIALTDDERAELLDWVAACQSAHHIDNTPGHRFGGIGSRLEENRDALIDYVNELLASRAAQVETKEQIRNAALEEAAKAVEVYHERFPEVDARRRMFELHEGQLATAIRSLQSEQRGEG